MANKTPETPAQAEPQTFDVVVYFVTCGGKFVMASDRKYEIDAYV